MIGESGLLIDGIKNVVRLEYFESKQQSFESYLESFESKHESNSVNQGKLRGFEL